MTQRGSDTSLPDQGASRRKFFKFLAASPLAALAYAALPSSWLEPVAAEVPPSRPAPLPCVNCGAPVLPPGLDETRVVPAIRPQVLQELPPQQAQEEQLTGSLITSPDDATNVWDFERVTHDNNLAQHWDYLHMGVEDYETRVANREGFQRLMLRPRRLGTEPASEFSTSIEILGQRFDSPLFLCPVAALQAYHTQGRSRRGPGGSAQGRAEDPVACELEFVRRDRRGAGRAALVPDLHEPRLEPQPAGDRPRGERGLPHTRVDDRPPRGKQPGAVAAVTGRRGQGVSALHAVPQPRRRLPAANEPRSRRARG